MPSPAPPHPLSPGVRAATWAFVGTRALHHPHTTDARTCMTAHLSGLPGGSALRLAERDGYASGAASAEAYRGAWFVASPRGESVDCFRHYEAVGLGPSSAHSTLPCLRLNLSLLACLC